MIKKKKSLQQNKTRHFYQARFCLWKKKTANLTQSVLVISILMSKYFKTFLLVICHSHIDALSWVLHNINVGQIDLGMGETFYNLSIAVAHRLRIKTRVSEESQWKWTCVISASLQRLFSSPCGVFETCGGSSLELVSRPVRYTLSSMILYYLL